MIELRQLVRRKEIKHYDGLIEMEAQPPVLQYRVITEYRIIVSEWQDVPTVYEEE